MEDDEEVYVHSQLEGIRMRSVEEMETLNKILDGRYAECDVKGHLGPKKKGVCQHCYRHYHYHSDIGRRIAESRRDIPIELQPVDLPAIEEREEQDIRRQQAWDRIYGLREIEEQLQKPKSLWARLFS